MPRPKGDGSRPCSQPTGRRAYRPGLWRKRLAPGPLRLKLLLFLVESRAPVTPVGFRQVRKEYLWLTPLEGLGDPLWGMPSDEHYGAYMSKP